MFGATETVVRINMSDYLDTIQKSAKNRNGKQELRRENFLKKYNLTEQDYDALREKIGRNQFGVLS